jgi:hypothetical protein
MVVSMRITIFWVIMPFNLETAQHFNRTYILHLQGQRVSQAWNHTSLLPASAGLLLSLVFDLEDRGDKFHHNTGLSLYYMV